MSSASHFFTKRQVWRRTNTLEILENRSLKRELLKNKYSYHHSTQYSAKLLSKEELSFLSNYETSISASDDDSYSQEKSKRKVTFDENSTVFYEVPNRMDMANDMHHLYWSSNDYDSFKADAVQELRAYWQLFGVTPRIAIQILYQPKPLMKQSPLTSFEEKIGDCEEKYQPVRSPYHTQSNHNYHEDYAIAPVISNTRISHLYISTSPAATSYNLNSADPSTSLATKVVSTVIITSNSSSVASSLSPEEKMPEEMWVATSSSTSPSPAPILVSCMSPPTFPAGVEYVDDNLTSSENLEFNHDFRPNSNSPDESQSNVFFADSGALFKHVDTLARLDGTDATAVTEDLGGVANEVTNESGIDRQSPDSIGLVLDRSRSMSSVQSNTTTDGTSYEVAICSAIQSKLDFVNSTLVYTNIKPQESMVSLLTDGDHDETELSLSSDSLDDYKDINNFELDGIALLDHR